MYNMQIVDSETVHRTDFVYDKPNGTGMWLLILTRSKAIFRVDSVEKEYPKGCLVLYSPTTPIYYRSCKDESYSDDWISFSISEADALFDSAPIGIPVQVPVTSYCHELFNMLCIENWYKTDYFFLNTDNIIQLLINKLIEYSKQFTIPTKYNSIHNLRKDIYLNPGADWSIPNMAKQLHISQSRLQCLYKKLFNTTCSRDVIEARIKLSKQLLVYSDCTINDIAERCGYNNIEHFFRQFKQVTGYTPNYYRTNHRLDEI